MKDLCSIDELTVGNIREIIKTADRPHTTAPNHHGKTVASIFLEPSTRTRLHFEHAAQGLGCHVLSVSNIDQTRMAKGETAIDTARMLGSMADVVVLRSARALDLNSFREGLRDTNTALINAGNGGDEHPIQGIQDYVAMCQFARTIPWRLVIIADPSSMRAANSFLKVVRLMKDERLQSLLVVWPTAPEGLQKCWIPNLKTALSSANVVYMNSMARPGSEGVYSPNPYRIKPGMLAKDAILLHPLPRHDEISWELDDTEFNAYHRQAALGPSIKRAALHFVLRRLGSCVA